MFQQCPENTENQRVSIKDIADANHMLYGLTQRHSFFDNAKRMIFGYKAHCNQVETKTVYKKKVSSARKRR